VVDDSQEHWWKVRDKFGYSQCLYKIKCPCDHNSLSKFSYHYRGIGYIPSNYVKEKELIGLQKYEYELFLVVSCVVRQWTAFFFFAVGTWETCHANGQRTCSNTKIARVVSSSVILLQRECIPSLCSPKCKNPSLQDRFLWNVLRGIKLCLIVRRKIVNSNLSIWTFRPTPQVKHYHIKQNSKLEFFLSEKHCCPTIAELVNYHRYDILIWCVWLLVNKSIIGPEVVRFSRFFFFE
jgi:hypothetical protein